MQSGTIVWLDVLIFQALATFAFDWLLLWATAAVTKFPASVGRRTGAALIGTGYYAVYVLSGEGLLPLYSLWRAPGFILLVSFAMLLFAFGGGPWRRLLRVAGHFYAIGFVGAGVGTVASFVLGSRSEPDSVIGFLAAGGAILLIAEIGWGAVQKRLWQQAYQLPVEVGFDGAHQRLTALVDTGNRLRDPLTDEPVIVIEHEAILPLLPDYLRPAVEQMAAGDLQGVTRLLASERWSKRFRIIPFSSVGREHGLLIAFKPDRVHLYVEGRRIAAGPCILGLCSGPLDPDGMYRALVHPELLEAATAQVEGQRPAEGTARPEEMVHPERRHAADVARHSEI